MCCVPPDILRDKGNRPKLRWLDDVEADTKKNSSYKKIETKLKTEKNGG
jgi:hypothetical protein